MSEPGAVGCDPTAHRIVSFLAKMAREVVLLQGQ
jgi:hypothetical protein